MTRTSRRKVAVVGAGAVGATFAYALAQSGLCDEIALIDKNSGLAQGQALDLAHGQPFFPTVSIHVGDASDSADAQLIVVTAGVAQLVRHGFSLWRRMQWLSDRSWLTSLIRTPPP
jgi:L-lactate dehydrogenase